jgi:hypothetical protein
VSTKGKGKAVSTKGKGKARNVISHLVQASSGSDDSDSDNPARRSAKTTQALINIAMLKSRVAYAKEQEKLHVTAESQAASTSREVGYADIETSI